MGGSLKKILVDGRIVSIVFKRYSFVFKSLVSWGNSLKGSLVGSLEDSFGECLVDIRLLDDSFRENLVDERDLDSEGDLERGSVMGLEMGPESDSVVGSESGLGVGSEVGS